METLLPQNTTTGKPEHLGLIHELGSFEAFNFREQSAVDRILTAAEVVAWDHDSEGEAEFWPAGDHPEVALLFRGQNTVTASELLDLDRLLTELGGDSPENFLQIHYAVNICGGNLSTLTSDEIQDNCLQIYFGTSLIDVRREAAFELFELYYPEAYRAWQASLCDGLIFDTDRFLDSPSLWVEEVRLADQVALLVAPQ